MKKNITIFAILLSISTTIACSEFLRVTNPNKGDRTILFTKRPGLLQAWFEVGGDVLATVNMPPHSYFDIRLDDAKGTLIYAGDGHKDIEVTKAGGLPPLGLARVRDDQLSINLGKDKTD